MKRAYGHDETEDFETLVEAERDEDGLTHFCSVIINKEGNTPSGTTRM